MCSLLVKYQHAIWKCWDKNNNNNNNKTVVVNAKKHLEHL